MRSFLGLLEFYGRYIPSLSTIKEPLTRLLKADQPFIWTDAQKSAFASLKGVLSSNQVLATFTPHKKVTLYCDASPVGIGAIMEQDGRPVAFISKTLSSAERGYAQIEREGLAIVWAVKRLHKYLYGRTFELVTDNKPLSHIFSPAKPVPVMTAARLQRWALALMAYDFSITCKKTTENQAADALSRCDAQSSAADTFDIYNVQEVVVAPPISKSAVHDAAKADVLMQKLIDYTINGWPSKDKLNVELTNYHRFKDQFTIHEHLLYRGARLVIPEILQHDLLDSLHEGHIGKAAMKSIARQSIWWKSIDKDIEVKCYQCDKCSRYKCSVKPCWKSWPLETRKWSRVHVDYCGPLTGGMYALVMVDAYSRWPEVHLMPSISSKETIKRFRRTFSQEGVPLTLVSDNGPSLVSEEMEQWLSAIGCSHLRTPPYHPKSNGLAERFVRTLKDHLRAAGPGTDLQTAVDRFLLQYRNTEHSTTGVAPAMRMRGALLRSNVINLRANGDKIWIKDYSDKKQIWTPAVVNGMEGNRIVDVTIDNGKVQRCHMEQTKPRMLSTEEENKEENAEHADDAASSSGNSVANSQTPRMRRKPDRFGVVEFNKAWESVMANFDYHLLFKYCLPSAIELVCVKYI